MCAFHLKYRPDSFDTYMGNEEIVDSVKKIIYKKDKPHCYLFFGNKGCGKTTLARIVAKELNCNDIMEINSGNNRGIDTARSIIENIQLKPLSGGNKVYILDEVHRTTREFQEAMLKPLEDTPKHVFFILCTTDPEKIIKTVQDRCFKFELQKLTYKEMSRLLQKIVISEKGKVSPVVIKEIIKNSESNRQALIKLEQVINIEDEEKAKNIITTFANEDSSVLDLCRILLQSGKWQDVQKILKTMDINKNNIESIRQAILIYMMSVILNNTQINDNSIKANIIIDNLETPFFDSGKAGFINALFSLFL